MQELDVRNSCFLPPFDLKTAHNCPNKGSCCIVNNIIRFCYTQCKAIVTKLDNDAHGGKYPYSEEKAL